MFEKFGKFDTATELNKKARELKEADNEKELIDLAEENGIPVEDAEDYMDDCINELCTPLSAAIGKIRKEAAELDIKGILEDWKTLLVDMCIEDESVRVGVRKNDKSLCDLMALLIKYSFENKVEVSEKIVKKCKVKNNGKEEQMRGPLYMGIPNKESVKKIAKEYYSGR